VLGMCALTHPSTRTGAIKPRQPVMSNVRRHQNIMFLYTFVANYGLGTYLDQQEAGTVPEAVQVYARENDFSFLTSLSVDDRQMLKTTLLTCSVEEAGELKNVWFCMVDVGQSLFLLHVVCHLTHHSSGTGYRQPLNSNVRQTLKWLKKILTLSVF